MVFDRALIGRLPSTIRSGSLLPRGGEGLGMRGLTLQQKLTYANLSLPAALPGDEAGRGEKESRLLRGRTR